MTAKKEKRREARRPILDTFSFFVVVPKKGIHRLPIHDLSKVGIGFSLDTEGEAFDDFKLNTGELLHIHFYMNQSLSIPLIVKVARVIETETTRKIGAEFVDTTQKGYPALISLIEMLGQLDDVAKIES